MSSRRIWRWRVVAFYIALLFISHLARINHQENPLSPQSRTVEVQAFDGDKALDKTIRLAYREFTDASSAINNAPTSNNSTNNDSQVNNAATNRAG